MTAEKAGALVRSVVRVISGLLALVLAVVLLPIWALGFTLQSLWDSFNAGRSAWKTLDQKMGAK